MNDLFEKCGESASVGVTVDFSESVYFKKCLTSRSNADDIDRYDQMCFDACQDLQDLAKELKKQNENT